MLSIFLCSAAVLVVGAVAFYKIRHLRLDRSNSSIE